MKRIEYVPQGVCSRLMTIYVNDDGTIENVTVIGGCNGNLKGICALMKGMNKDEVIAKFDGIQCHDKGTSCPDQIAQALKKV